MSESAVLAFCAACQRLFIPPYATCPACHSPTDPVVVGGLPEGHAEYAARLRAERTCAEVRLENAARHAALIADVLVRGAKAA